MEHSVRRLLSILVLILLAVVLFYSLGLASRSHAQAVERSLDIERYASEPLALVDLKVSEQSVKSRIDVLQRRGDDGLDNVTFKDTEDWFRRVSVKLRNSGDRPISGLQAYLYFKVPGTATLFRVGLDASTKLKKGVVGPGEEVDLAVNDQRWKFTADILKQYGADANRATVTFSIERVWFSKDLQWSKGVFLRRDPYNPQKWNVIGSSSESRIPAVGQSKPAADSPAKAKAAGRAPHAGSLVKSVAPLLNLRILTPEPQANATCQTYGGEILDHCSTFGCFTRTELGSVAGYLSAFPVADICVEENPNIDNPAIHCRQLTTHYILQNDPSCSQPTPTPTPPPCVGSFDACSVDADCCSGTHCNVISGSGSICYPDYTNCSDQHLQDWCIASGGYMDATCQCFIPPCPGNCEVAGGDEFPSDYCTYPGTGCPSGWQSTGGCCRRIGSSPVIVDVDGSGFHLTSAGDGVWFDFFDTGQKIKISWIAAYSTNAFLVLDRNGNGQIDSGKELFGNLTPQPPTAEPNGFIALAEYDKPGSGGNGDGVINHRDSIFLSLRLWRDINHNGVSEAAELSTLPQIGLKTLDLNYKKSKRTDQYGNEFRYRAKVRDTHDAQLGRWAWDVFLVLAQ